MVPHLRQYDISTFLHKCTNYDCVMLRQCDNSCMPLRSPTFKGQSEFKRSAVNVTDSWKLFQLQRLYSNKY
jgi:hypothetical protein